MLFTNRGDGAFETERRPWHDGLGPGSPRAAAPADLDGDGDIDIVLAEAATSGGIYALTNEGNADFNVRPLSPYTNWAFWTPVTADFDGDGRQDIAVTVADGTARVYLQDGEKSFALAHELGAGSGNQTIDYGIAVDDFNNDAIPDVAYASTDGIRLAFGVRTDVAHSISFTEPRRIGSQTATRIATGDINDDGRLDLVSVSGLANYPSVQLLTNMGDSFEALELRKPTQFGDVAVADFDNDGRLDVVLGDAWYGTIEILLNRSGRLEAGPTYRVDPVFENGALPRYDIRVDDFNGDGVSDILVTSSRNKVYILMSTKGSP